MKGFMLCLVLACITFFGISFASKINGQEDIPKQPRCVVKEAISDVMLHKLKFESDGHHYITFTSGSMAISIVHDPDCPCHKGGR